MRPFEVLFIALVVAAPLPARYAHSRPTIRGPLASAFYLLVASVLVAHLWEEGAHWQLAPAYLAAILVLFLFQPRGSRLWRRINTAAILLLACAASCFTIVLPVFALPDPTGPYSIGTQILPMTDTARQEDAVSGFASPRQFVTQVWYPAQPSHNPRAPYRRRSETSLAASYLSVDWTHARYNAPPIRTALGFPLLLYNPGWNGRRTQDTFLLEELVSHGYVVLAIDHPYNSAQVELADGRVIKQTYTPELSDETSSKAAVYAVIDNETEKEAADTFFALDQIKLKNSDPSSVFFHTLDLQEIGAFGYSLGAAVAAEVAWQDPEIRAVLDLDTPLYAHAAKHGIPQAFFLLSETLPHTTLEQRSRMTFGQRRNAEMDEDDYARQLPLFERPGDYQIVLPGTLHTSFQDQILFSPLPSISGAGAIPPKRLVIILREYTLAFFDQSLRGISSPLLTAPKSPFPEARVDFRSPPPSK